MIKGLGCNYVRLCHYPYDRHIVEPADEIGLFVTEEPGYWIVNFQSRGRGCIKFASFPSMPSCRRIQPFWKMPAVMRYEVGRARPLIPRLAIGAVASAPVTEGFAPPPACFWHVEPCSSTTMALPSVIAVTRWTKPPQPFATLPPPTSPACRSAPTENSGEPLTNSDPRVGNRACGRVRLLLVPG
jgi:hypothetical protein